MDTAKLNTRAEAVTLGPTSTSKQTAVVNVAATVRDEKDSSKIDKTDQTEREQLLTAVTDMQEYAQSAQRNLQFKLDDDSQRMIVTVTEASTGKVIRQMPSEEALRLSENLDEIRSVLFSGKV